MRRGYCGALPVSGVLVVQRRLSFLCVSAVAASTLAALSPAGAAEEQWSPLQEASGSTLAVAVDDQSTALISVGGADDATGYDPGARPPADRWREWFVIKCRSSPWASWWCGPWTTRSCTRPRALGRPFMSLSQPSSPGPRTPCESHAGPLLRQARVRGGSA